MGLRGGGPGGWGEGEAGSEPPRKAQLHDDKKTKGPRGAVLDAAPPGPLYEAPTTWRPCPGGTRSE